MTTRPTLLRLPVLAIGLVLVNSGCGEVDTEFGFGTLTNQDAGATDDSSLNIPPRNSAPGDAVATGAASQTTRPTSASSSNTANTTRTSDTRESSSRTTGDDDTSTPPAEETSTALESEESETSEVDATGSDATSSDAASSDELTDDTSPGDEVPMTDHCEAVAVWDEEWTQWEDEVLLLVNEYRAEGADCGEEGVFGPADPLETDEVLRCSARLHSLDMFDRMYFDHVNPDGLDPFNRMELAGFSGSTMGENIAMGQTDPVEVMVAWIDSDGHCSNILNPNYTLIGVGYYPGSPDNFRARNYWTQNLGAPRQQFGGMGGLGN
jgi:uncharacterized protein YkwD